MDAAEFWTTNERDITGVIAPLRYSILRINKSIFGALHFSVHTNFVSVFVRRAPFGITSIPPFASVAGVHLIKVLLENISVLDVVVY